MSLQYAIHAYAWTGKWSNATLNLIDLAREFGFDLIEIPLMDIDLVDPQKVRERLQDGGNWSSDVRQRYRSIRM